MALLRLRFGADAAEAWEHGDPPRTLFEFALVERGGATRQGRAELADLPLADTLEIVLPARAARLLRLKLPPVKPAVLRRVLPNLVEDSVIGDPAESFAAVLPGIGADGLREVAVLDRRWLRAAQRVAQLRAARRVVVVTEAMLAPSVPFLCAEGGEAWLRHADGVLPFALDGAGTTVATGPAASVAGSASAARAPADPPPALRLAAARLRSGAVASLDCAGLDADLCARWSDALGLALAPSDWRWTDAAPALPDASLLQFEFARSTRGAGQTLRPWRWAIGFAAAALLVWTVGLNADWLRLRREHARITAQMETDFRTAFPEVPLVVDPLRQARRQVELASTAGQDRYLELTTALAGLLPPNDATGSLRTLNFTAGTLRASLAPAVAPMTEQLLDALRARGYDAVAEPQGDGSQILVLRKREAS
ncbi:type II secretion system protein GspL [Derxia gummosa]|uniref:Type II secretion system protein GspL n=1 Tax=Derxia gummosa DSM 723 TaxID=1121388 RepID=A0A8B6X4X7_9BURK|nr:type II secretion system protein GspL [Derxia gummosa]